MRAIHLATLDKVRPALVLTRTGVVPHLAKITVAPITGRVRGLSTEVAVGPANGLDTKSVVSCDNLITIPTTDLGRHVGFLLPDQEAELTRALVAAFDLAAMA